VIKERSYFSAEVQIWSCSELSLWYLSSIFLLCQFDSSSSILYSARPLCSPPQNSTVAQSISVMCIAPSMWHRPPLQSAPPSFLVVFFIFLLFQILSNWSGSLVWERLWKAHAEISAFEMVKYNTIIIQYQIDYYVCQDLVTRLPCFLLRHNNCPCDFVKITEYTWLHLFTHSTHSMVSRKASIEYIGYWGV